MIARLQRRPDPASVWIAGVLATCVVFGLVAGIKPGYAVLGVFGIGFVLLVFSNLVIGIACFAALSFLDTLATGGAALSFDKVAGLLLFMSWLLSQTTKPRGSARDILAEHSTLFTWIVIYMAWTVLSALWASSASAALQQAYRYALDMLLIPIMYAAVNTRRDLIKVIVGYLIGAGFSTIYGLANPPAATSAAGGRLVGSLGEANQSATVLVAALALGAGIWLLAQRSPRLRKLVICVTFLAVVGLVTTVSRAGLIALGAVLISGTVVGGRWRRAAMWLTLIGVVAIPIYFLALAPKSARDRVTSNQSSGRNDIWTVAWRAFSAHPVLGVGAGNFEIVSRSYLQQPGQIISADDFITDPKVVHNIYLEQLTTLGVPGLIMLLAILISVIRAGLRATHISERDGDAELELLSRCWILALVAFLSADFFASELVSKQLWLVFAIGPVILKLTHDSQTRVTA